MMYMVYLLAALISICGMLCVVDWIVRIWEKADRRARPTQRVTVYKPAPVRKNNVTPLYTVGRLPDREAVRNVYALSDQFADRFREIVNS